MSCSDKLAKWVLLGCQGSLLSTLLTEPLFMDSITIACPRGVQNKAGRAACVQALQRAVQGLPSQSLPHLHADAGAWHRSASCMRGRRKIEMLCCHQC